MFNLLRFIPNSTGTYVSSEIPSNFLRETYSNYQPLHLSSHLTYPPHQNMNYFQKFITPTLHVGVNPVGAYMRNTLPLGHYPE